MKHKARRLGLLLVLCIAPAFLDGCILTDLLGGLGGGAGGLAGLLGGGGGAGGVQPGLAGRPPAGKPLAPIAGSLNPASATPGPAGTNKPSGANI
jgi:hypothetical protein